MFFVATLTLISHPQMSRPTSRGVVLRWGSPDAKDQALKALNLWKTNPGPAALARYQEGYRDALRGGHHWAMWWYLTALGTATNSVGSYSQALDYMLSARDVAQNSGLATETALAWSNLSSLYLHVYDKSSALAAAREAYRIAPQVRESPERIKLLVAIARVFLTCGDTSRAMLIFGQVISSASSAGDSSSEALAWDQMGWELLRGGSLQRAEDALNTAFRLRVLTHDPLVFATEHHLALLHWKTGRFESASHLIQASFERRGTDRLEVPEHLMYLTRARIRASSGDLEAALQDYLQATEAMDEWRNEGLLGDTFRISTDALMDEVYAGAIDTAAKLYHRSGEEHYAVLSWELSERIRALSLRELVADGRAWTRNVTPEYWRLLERLRSLEADQFAAQGSPVNSVSEETTRVRMHLAEMEARAQAEESGKPLPSNGDGDTTHPACHIPKKCGENSEDRISLTHIKQVLGSSRTLISFQLGDEFSYRWVISRRRFELSILPGKRQLDGDVTRLRESLKNDSRQAESDGEKLYSELFSGVPRGADHDQWLLALDDSLFKLPVAALISGRQDGRPVYLIAQKTLELVSGAWAIGRPSERSGEPDFVGMGDGIYNTADSRYRASAPCQPFFRNPVAAFFTIPKPALQLPRLLGSGKEIEQCARNAGGPATILTGESMNHEAFFAALSKHPKIIHIAAHFLTESTGDRTSIALGLKQDQAGRPRLDILTAEDIAGLRVPGSIVVMSGCSSGTGQVVPAAGLLGLARAWLAAGAKAVISSQWPAPDDTGEIFSKFYNHLRDSDHGDTLVAAEALRRAQVDMLRSGTWRSDPRYWAAYQILGRSN